MGLLTNRQKQLDEQLRCSGVYGKTSADSAWGKYQEAKKNTPPKRNYAPHERKP